MPAVPSTIAEYLQSDALYEQSVSAATRAAFGDLAAESTAISPLRSQAGAAAEAARQQAFLDRPAVRESVQVIGVDLLEQMRGRCWTVTADAPGYGGGGAVVFVLGGDELREQGITVLEVLRRL